MMKNQGNYQIQKYLTHMIANRIYFLLQNNTVINNIYLLFFMQIHPRKAAKNSQRYPQKNHSDFLTILDLAGMELTFPIAALIVLCFVFVARKVLITHQCFGYC